MILQQKACAQAYGYPCLPKQIIFIKCRLSQIVLLKVSLLTKYKVHLREKLWNLSHQIDVDI